MNVGEFAIPAVTACDLPVTVAICTLGQHAGLVSAVRSVLQQTRPPAEVIVVDNDPSTGRVLSRLGSLAARVRVVAEPRRGLSAARNRAMRECRSPVLAFTDDDAVVEPTWLAALSEPFHTLSEVAAVTGRVLSLSNDEASVWFEQGFSFDRGGLPFAWSWPEPISDGALAHLRTRIPSVSAGPQGAVFPISAGEFGTGNNMAFRTEELRLLGGFDELLGAGTPARGGEDLDVFRRVLLAGGLIVYHPGAVVRHRHRSDLDELTRQAFGYGTGMAASVARFASRNPRYFFRALRAVPAGLSLLLRRDSPKNVRKAGDYPKRLDRAERLGYALGPLMLIASAVQRRDRG